jgi:Zn-dependent M28 family amino/carboxypeptidase
MFEPILDPRKPNWKLWLACTVLVLSLVVGFVSIWRMTQMPLRSYMGHPQPLSKEEAEVAARLLVHVKYLSETVGERNLLQAGSLQAASAYLRDNLSKAGYTVTEHTYSVSGQPVNNLEVTLTGSDSADAEVVVGAHYDSVRGAPGANDNASGVAAVLELARQFQGSKLHKSVRFVLFVNEEPPYFQASNMGSLVYAQQLRRDHVPISAMISLETIGYYSDEKGSQKYPPLLGLFYPNRGDFIGFVGNSESRDLVRRTIRRFRESTSFPSEGIAAPADWPGIGWSDHWSSWQEGYPAIMITDTAPFRYPYYHTPRDTANWVDSEKMAKVVVGVRRVVESPAMGQ